MITSRETCCSLGRAEVPRDRVWVADSRQDWFVSHFECYSSSSRSTTWYREKKPQNAGQYCQIQLPAAKPGSGERRALQVRASPFVVEPLQTISFWIPGSHPHLQRSVLVFWAYSTLRFPGETGNSLSLNTLAENMGFGAANGLGFLWSLPRAHKWYLSHTSSPIRNSCCKSSTTSPGKCCYQMSHSDNNHSEEPRALQ